uniref:Transposase n=1 Tax=Steinernema glaseri TaxID=37863 RepID=A0A1I8AMV3_9BILA
MNDPAPQQGKHIMGCIMASQAASPNQSGGLAQQGKQGLTQPTGRQIPAQGPDFLPMLKLLNQSLSHRFSTGRRVFFYLQLALHVHVQLHNGQQLLYEALKGFLWRPLAQAGTLDGLLGTDNPLLEDLRHHGFTGRKVAAQGCTTQAHQTGQLSHGGAWLIRQRIDKSQ